MGIHVKDLFNITWKGYDMGVARAHAFYKQDLQQVITKFECLTKIDSDAIALFITPQFEQPYFRVEIEQATIDGKPTSMWDIKVWETNEGFERRARHQNYSVTYGMGPSLKYPLYTISIRPKYGYIKQ